MKVAGLITCLIMLMPVSNSIGQEFSSFNTENFNKEVNYGYFNYYQVMVHTGKLPSTARYYNFFEERYKAIELRVGSQASGRYYWQQVHNYPQYGLGIYAGDLGGKSVDTVIGTPLAVYFYFGAPWARFWRFTINTDMSYGLSFGFKPYDEILNPYNDIIASRINLYFNFNVLFYYMLSEKIDLSLGFDLTHFSSGRMFMPQKGINIFGLNLGVKYNFNSIGNYVKKVNPDYKPASRPEIIKSGWPEFKKYHEVQFMVAAGKVETRLPSGVLTGPRYFTSSFSVDYARVGLRRLKYGLGLDAFYDGSLAETYSDIPVEEVSTIQKMSFGTHIGFQYLIERFAFLYNIGTYIYKESPARGDWYMRVGGRIGLSDHIHLHLCLKTMNKDRADWIEWGLAYYLILDRQRDQRVQF